VGERSRGESAFLSFAYFEDQFHGH
jgi:hypothetical protein